MKRRTLVVGVALVLIGCTTSQVVNNLQRVVQTAQAVLPILGSVAGVDPNIISTITGYLSDVNQASIAATTILASADTDAVKTAKIVQAFVNVVKFRLPAGTPQTIASVVEAVMSAVANFLQDFQTPSGTLKIDRTKTQLSAGELARLGSIRAQAETNLKTLKR